MISAQPCAPAPARWFAALAQAALLERVAIEKLDAAVFADWARRQRALQFVAQNLLDLEVKPRWHPRFVSAERTSMKLVGRPHNAAQRSIHNVTELPLLDLLTKRTDDGVIHHPHLTRSLYAGPLEGSECVNRASLPLEPNDLLNAVLAEDRLESKSIIGLIDTAGASAVDGGRIGRAVHLTRRAGYHLSEEGDMKEHVNLIAGLADVASFVRSVDLADDVRLIMRRLRFEVGDHLPTREEFFVCLAGAAAHSCHDT